MPIFNSQINEKELDLFAKSKELQTKKDLFVKSKGLQTDNS